MTLSPTHGWAVVLAALGAVLFGLSAVRHHGAMQVHVTSVHTSLTEHVRALGRLVRHPSWLIGWAQITVGGLLHIVALTLAPIILIQPVGVLAVPVTVVAYAIQRRRRPDLLQVIGSALSVIGIVALTLVLLTPDIEFVRLPRWEVQAATVAALVGAGLLVILAGGRVRPLVRCLSLAVIAAVLFGLNSILIRTVGAILPTGIEPPEVPLLVVSIIGFAAALPVGLWAMQSAYVSGSPHVVICCLTLMDPLAAVIGGRLLLHDGATISGPVLLLVVLCALIAAAGVVLLSIEYPDDLIDVPDEPQADQMTPH